MWSSRLGAVFLALLAASDPNLAQSPQGRSAVLPVVDEAATVMDKLGAPAALTATFTDSAGVTHRLDSLIRRERPTVLNLGYYGCPSLCGFMLQSLVDAMSGSGMRPGRDFNLLSISIDHREAPSLAAEKKASFVSALGWPDVTPEWHFLVGDPDQIEALAASVGWRFRWSEHTQQYDHPPVIVLLSPDGRVARYLDARSMDASVLRTGLIEAGQGRIGSFLERILASCLTYDANTGAYTVTAMTIMRIGGGLTVLALASMVFLLWRRERTRMRVAAA
jgi:protein SCO1/2